LRPTSTELLQHPFIQKGLKNEGALKDLLTETIPILSKAREEKREREKETGAEKPIKSGTIITANTSSKRFTGEVGTGTNVGTTVLKNATQQYDESSTADEF